MEPYSHEEIQLAEDQLLDALRQGDIDTLELLLHDDLRFVIPNGHVITKEEDVENYRKENIVITSLKTRNQEITMMGDNAVVTVIQELQGSYFKQPIEGSFRYLRVWKRSKAGWKIVGGASVPF